MLRQLTKLGILSVVACSLVGLGAGLALGYHLHAQEIAYAQAHYRYFVDFNWPEEPYYLAGIGSLLGCCFGIFAHRLLRHAR